MRPEFGNLFGCLFSNRPVPLSLGRNAITFQLSPIFRELPMVPDLIWLNDLARRGSALAREQLGQIARQLKRGEEAVTEADRAVQRLIVEALSDRYPDDGIIGEENDDGSAITNRLPRAGTRVWVIDPIDPIDGTNNYIAGFGACAVCIGLLEDGMPIMGVVYDIARDESFLGVHIGAKSHGAWHVRAGTWYPTTAQSEAPGAQSLLMITSNLIIGGTLPTWAIRLLTVCPWKLRMLGSAALECAQVGAGTACAAITLNGKLWDVVAAAAVVLGAGGRITDFAGRDVFPFDLTDYNGGKVPFLAASPMAQAPLLAELAS